MRGVLLVPSSSPTLSPIYDDLDVSGTSNEFNITWFHLNHDMVSRRIYKLSFYGGRSITPCSGHGNCITRILRGADKKTCTYSSVEFQYVLCINKAEFFLKINLSGRSHS